MQQNRNLRASVSPTETLILLTPQEAAAFLRVTESALTKWRFTKSQNLRWVAVGRRVRYLKNDLEAFVTSNLVGGMS